MTEQWLSIVEYSRAFGISDMTIRRRIRTGKIDAELREGKYFIPVRVDPVTGELLKVSRSAQRAPTKTYPSSRSHLQETHSKAVTYRDSNVRETMQHKHALRDHEGHHISEGRVPVAPPSVASPVVSRPIATHTHLATSQVASANMTNSHVVEPNALIEYCNRSLDTIKSQEKAHVNELNAKLQYAEEQIRHRDLKMSHLQQQIEDLQLLVQILEKKKA